MLRPSVVETAACGVVAFAVAAVATPLAGAIARRLGLIAWPSPRGVHTRPTPLLGGLAVLCGLGAGLAAVPGAVAAAGPLCAGAAAMAAIGIVDDRVALGWRAKLAAQLVVAGAYVALAGPPGAGGAAAVLAVVWIAAITNAINLVDNTDGLAAGTAAIAALGFAAIALGDARGDVAVPAIGVCGAALGFFVHNFPRARVFLGDAGSLPLGFVLAALPLALAGDRSLGSSLPLLLPLGYPVADTAYVIVSRWRRGVPLAHGGTDHTSHALARRTELRLAVIALLAVSALLGATGVLVTPRGAP